MPDRRRYACKRHLARQPIGNGLDAEHGLFQLVDDVSRLVHKHAAQGSQFDFPGGPREQRDAKRFFQFIDATRQCRLRQEHRIGCRLEAAQIGYGQERSQVRQIEIHVSYARILVIFALYTGIRSA
ncbi:hypothetical protein D3C72_1700640 [compost metagenome]